MEAGKKIPDPKLIFEGASERFHSDPPRFIETPLPALNEIIVGLPESELIIIAGQPGSGKTSLAMQMAAYAAMQGQAVGVFSMEMSRAQLGERLACSALNITANQLRSRWKTPLSAADTASIDTLYKEQAALPIFVDDRGGLQIDEIHHTAKYWKEKYAVKAIFLDYVGQIEGGGMDRQEAIGSAARRFKIIAKELSIPFVALSQVNRAINNRESRIPQQSDLRDSGQLEQVADIILMFSFPNSPDDDADIIRECQIHVKKNRNGPAGIAHVQFNRGRTQFETLDPDIISQTRANSEPRQQEKRIPWPGKKVEPKQLEPS